MCTSLIAKLTCTHFAFYCDGFHKNQKKNPGKPLINKGKVTFAKEYMYKFVQN